MLADEDRGVRPTAVLVPLHVDDRVDLEQQALLSRAGEQAGWLEDDVKPVEGSTESVEDQSSIPSSVPCSRIVSRSAR